MYLNIAFDVDDTLTESKQVMDDDMVRKLVKLNDFYNIMITGGGSLETWDWQFIKKILEEFKRTDYERVSDFFLAPTNATKMLKIIRTPEGEYELDEIYSREISIFHKRKIKDSLKKFSPYPEIEDAIDDRKNQITLSVLGKDAPLEKKKVWDADKSKRMKIVDQVICDLEETVIRNYDIFVAGTTSIDVVPKNVNKGRAMEFIMNYCGGKSLFIGDALYRGGNDWAVFSNRYHDDMDVIKVNDIEETREIIKKFNSGEVVEGTHSYTFMNQAVKEELESA